MVSGLVIGVVVATAGGSIAGYNMLSKKQPAYAEVLGVDEIKETVQTPREVCENVPVTRQKPVQDQNRVIGTVTGALAGGLLGNQIGKGTGKKIATVAGAAAGVMPATRCSKACSPMTPTPPPNVIATR